MAFDRGIDISEAARGKWKGILGQLGVEDSFLRNIHGPCPMCGGSDRYRWDNKEGRGTFFCAQCGAGDGWDLIKGIKGWNFVEASKAVKSVLGIVEPDKTKPARTEKQNRETMHKVLQGSTEVRQGDVVWQYMKSRGLERDVFPRTIRTAESCWFERDLSLPAMLAIVHDDVGNPVNLHRTYLAADGSGKANVLEPKRVMPGELPNGSAVRLFGAKEVMGIAEGIETAFAAARLFKIPVWAALNAKLLENWIPPSGVQRLYIFGDHDQKYGGQAAAFRLAHRMSVRRDPLECEVMIPGERGSDWADALVKGQ